MTDEQRRVYEAIASGPRGGVRGPFLPLLHNPELTERVQSFGEYLRYGTRIPPELVELAILVASRRWTCQFEWYAHAPLARKAGLSDDVIEAVAEGRRSDAMSPDQRLLFDVCTALHESGRLTDELFEAAAGRFERRGVLDLIAICGYYAMLAMVLNVADAPLPNGAAPPLRELPA
jgi:4-carboxymuconolactone decarboxylase